MQEDLIEVRYEEANGESIPHIKIHWVPTVPNCHLALTIALSIRVKLLKELKIGEAGLADPISRAKLQILVQPGKHDTAAEIDKQVNDKERVLAALENSHLRAAIDDLIREREWY